MSVTMLNMRTQS